MAAYAVAAGWLAGYVFWRLAPYGAFWGYIFVQLALITYFYARLRPFSLFAGVGDRLRPPTRKIRIYQSLFWLHVARLAFTALGPFLVPPYWLMFVLNRLFEAGLIVIISSSAIEIVFAKRPGWRSLSLRWLERTAAALRSFGAQ